MIGAEAVIHFKISSFSMMSGIGYSRMEDIGSYKVNYVTNDSVGYFLRVISFVPDPRNPGEIDYIGDRKPFTILSRIMFLADKQIITLTSISRSPSVTTCSKKPVFFKRGNRA